MNIDYSYFEKNHHRIHLFKDCIDFEFVPYEKEPHERFNLYRNYHYVHELQNLYFALTGEELKKQQ